MHDMNGTPLKKGDSVLIHAVVKDVQAHPDYCNVQVETVQPRRGDNKPETITLNTGVLVLFKQPVSNLPPSAA